MNGNLRGKSPAGFHYHFVAVVQRHGVHLDQNLSRAHSWDRDIVQLQVLPAYCVDFPAFHRASAGCPLIWLWDVLMLAQQPTQ
ncbi:hypothetical protein [Brenneria goodwinii]|uniref:hypothetical protein n=1 Tax=Brenneria goodwinii TaxID=1109412 RepID=UPI001F2298C8|nr:hypothetical protein [Brenneria goodwinii]